MTQDNDWFEFKTLKRRGYDSQVWVPLLAVHTKAEEGESGHVGFASDYLGVGSVAVPVESENAVRQADANDMIHAYRGGPHVDGAGNYIAVGSAVGFHANIDGVSLALEQSIPGAEHIVWDLNQDFVLALNLVRDGDNWVRVEEGRVVVARLIRAGDGSPASLDVKVEFLKDYLCARKMGLVVGVFAAREKVLAEEPGLPWRRPTQSEENPDEGWRWRGDIHEIHEGGHQFGATMHVMSVSRTDYDPEDEAPSAKVGEGEFKSESWDVPLGKGPKLFQVSGELWKTDWISPSLHSPRVADETMPSTAFFIVGGAGRKVLGDNLPDGHVWIWFRPEIVNDVLSFPDGYLVWHTADTGHLGYTPGHGVHFGLNEEGFLTVLAVDVRRLPHWDQAKWAGFDVPPTGKVSEELIASQIRTDPADTVAPEPEIEGALDRLGRVVQERYGISLYHTRIDRGILRNANRFTAVNHDGLLNLAKDLTRLFSDRVDAINLQKTALVRQPKEPYAAINAIRYALATMISDSEAEAMCSALFGIYYLRVADAHLPGGDLERAYKTSNVDPSKPFVKQGHDMILAYVTSLIRIATTIESAPRPQVENGEKKRA